MDSANRSTARNNPAVKETIEDAEETVDRKRDVAVETVQVESMGSNGSATKNELDEDIVFDVVASV